jgi:hypothetical protein
LQELIDVYNKMKEELEKEPEDVPGEEQSLGET